MVKVTESGMNRLSSMSSTIMQSLTFITFTVSEKIPMLKVFNKPRHLADKNILSPLNTTLSHINCSVHNLFNVCSNHTALKPQRTKVQNMQFAVCISDTPVTLTEHPMLSLSRRCLHSLLNLLNHSLLNLLNHPLLNFLNHPLLNHLNHPMITNLKGFTPYSELPSLHKTHVLKKSSFVSGI